MLLGSCADSHDPVSVASAPPPRYRLPVIVTLQIPDELLEAAPGGVADWEFEAKKELALAFYARGLISAGKASELAGVPRRQFEAWLGERRIERPFSDADLRADLEWAAS